MEVKDIVIRAKEEFKQTEVGIIPKDWEIKKLGEIGKFSKGQGIKKDEAQSGDIACVRYGELYTRHNDYVKNYYSFISDSVAQSSKKLRKGDILFAGSGETKTEIGKCAAFIDDNDAYVGGDVVLLSPFDSNSLFLGYLLNAPFIAKQKASRGQGDAVVHISAGQLSTIQIPLPPTKAEQTAIATVLSDTYALISRLETLIEKKRAIKQGAMQQLLKPKEGWVVKKLGEVAEILTGSTPPTQDRSNYGDEYLFVSPADLNSKKYVIDTDKKLSKKGFEASRKFPKNSILFTCIGSTIGKSGIASRNLTSNQQINAVLPNDGYITDFIYYTLNHLAPVIKASASEQAVPLINKNDFRSILIAIPSLEEQTRIAQILSDMDAEIAGLEQKLAKYKLVKQGMMQELLTGKTRLVAPQQI